MNWESRRSADRGADSSYSTTQSADKKHSKRQGRLLLLVSATMLLTSCLLTVSWSVWKVLAFEREVEAFVVQSIVDMHIVGLDNLNPGMSSETVIVHQQHSTLAIGSFILFKRDSSRAWKWQDGVLREAPKEELIGESCRLDYQFWTNAVYENHHELIIEAVYPRCYSPVGISKVGSDFWILDYSQNEWQLTRK